MRDGDFGDLVVCAIVALLAVYWVYAAFNGKLGGAGSRDEYYQNSAR